jgi:hypothetical protein
MRHCRPPRSPGDVLGRLRGEEEPSTVPVSTVSGSAAMRESVQGGAIATWQTCRWSARVWSGHAPASGGAWAPIEVAAPEGSPVKRRAAGRGRGR